MTEKEQALAYLNRDRVLNISIIEPLRLERGQVLAAGPQGVAVQVEDVTMVAADSYAAAMALVPPDFHTLNVMGGRLAEQVQESLGLTCTCQCYQAAYLETERLSVAGDIRQLDMTYFQPVLEGYSLFHDPAYIAQRLTAGVIYGAFVEGHLAGFVGEHSEGSMGMLEVFPAFRRRGLALALESFQINRYLAQGRVPYDQVIVGNTASMALQRKAGMTLSTDTMAWLRRPGERSGT